MMQILVLILTAIDCIAATYLLCRWLSRKQKALLRKDFEWALNKAYDKFRADEREDELQYCPYCGKKLTDKAANECPSCGRRLPR